MDNNPTSCPPTLLIADSGSTKTEWVVVGQDAAVSHFHTQGINPVHQDAEVIRTLLLNELVPALPPYLPTPCHVFFYGSGCLPSLQPMVQQLLQQALPAANSIEVAGDLLGAARALCGYSEGIACILGTGANSCLYDGKQIVDNTPPLGYVLGDEGSGAVLGIRFLNAVLKGLLPTSLKTELLDYLQMDQTAIISRVYRQPLANRWLASLSPFIAAHINHDGIRQLVTDCLRDFFRRNVVQYHRNDLPVGFVGSIAYHYQEPLREAAAAEGFTVGPVMQSPINGLIGYHTGNTLQTSSSLPDSLQE